MPPGIKLSEPCKSILQRLIQEFPEKRMQYEQFREHEFVKLTPEEYKSYLQQLQMQVAENANQQQALEKQKQAEQQEQEAA